VHRRLSKRFKIRGIHRPKFKVFVYIKKLVNCFEFSISRFNIFLLGSHLDVDDMRVFYGVWS
jgi:hypothetical protein